MSKQRPALSIRFLGSLSVHAGEVRLPLPASRKTRALLGYLVLTETWHGRDRLCELLWEIPDDPRGALRWSLSKLRPVINFDGRERLLTSRGQVVVLLDDIDVDVHRIRSGLVEGGTPKELSDAWHETTEALLDDCVFANQPNFSAWLELERQKVANLRVSLARRLALSDVIDPDDAAQWADRWLDDSPFDAQAAQAAVALRRRAGRMEEAALRASELELSFRKAGREAPSFMQELAGQAQMPDVQHHVPATPRQRLRQTVRFARTVDDICLAWASAGAGDAPALVRAASWLTHIELDWEAPMWSAINRELALRHRFIRYDERGCGLSDWEVPNINFNCFVTDLETIADTAGLDRFALLGVSHGAAVAIEYAARHADRVSHLILFGGSSAGWRHRAGPAEVRQQEAAMVLAEAEWERANALYPRLFSATFMPDATPEELAWFEEFRSMSTSPRNAVRFLQAFSEIDVRRRLSEIRVPTLVIHSRDDQCVPASAGRALAAAIPGAQFVSLQSRNHLLIGREPASRAFTQAVQRFLAAIP